MAISFPYRIDRTGRTAAPPDEAAHVRELIEQVLFTTPGERVNRPAFGTGAHQLLFAPADEQLLAATQHLIRGALQQWLAAWIEVRDVDVSARDSTVEITVRYVLRRTNEQREDVFTRTG